MPDVSTDKLPDEHPLKDVTGQALFDAVFSHLAVDQLADVVAQEKAANDAAQAAKGGPVTLNSVLFDGQKLVFGYELAPA